MKRPETGRPMLKRDYTAAVLQSWVNAIRQQSPDATFAIDVSIVLKLPGKPAEKFEIGR